MLPPSLSVRHVKQTMPHVIKFYDESTKTLVHTHISHFVVAVDFSPNATDWFQFTSDCLDIFRSCFVYCRKKKSDISFSAFVHCSFGFSIELEKGTTKTWKAGRRNRTKRKSKNWQMGRKHQFLFFFFFSLVHIYSMHVKTLSSLSAELYTGIVGWQ